MSMETHEEPMAATTTNSSSSIDNDCSHAIVKGKRTKRRRLRQYLPIPVATAATPSTSSSGEISDSIDEEEEDMANCLILLAQGGALEAGPKSGAHLEEEGVGGDGGDGGAGRRGEKFTSRRLAEAATMTNGKVSFYVYECKTCNKCFPSFQALGGHRSSHKKLKMAAEAAVASEEKKTTEELSLQISIANSYPNSNLLPNYDNKSITASPALHNHHHHHNNNNNIASSNKQKVHECSICGSEFSSGQALGGHMRRHRAAAILPETQEVKGEKSILPLDLNLPAPADDDRGDCPGSPSFAFARKGPLIFSASALVDCHY